MKIKLWMSEISKRAAALIYDYKWVSLLICLYLIGVLCLPLPHLSFDTSNEAMLNKNDPALQTYEEFREQFGRDDIIVIGVDLPQGITQESLNSIISLHKELEADIPYDKKVTSIYNAYYIYSDGNKLFKDEPLRNWPQTSVNETELANIILNNPAYKNVLLAENKQFAAILVEMTSSYANAKVREAESEKVVDNIRTILKHRSDIKTYLTGSPVVTEAFSKTTMKDLINLSILCLAVIAIALLLFFRRLSAILMPLLIVEVSALCAVGLMAFTHTAYTLTMNGLVPVILAVGTLEAVYVLQVFYRLYDQTGDKREAITSAIGQSFPAIVLTNLTTAVGEASFCSASLPSIASLGIFSAIAVIFVLLFSLLLLPMLIAIFPIKKKRREKKPSTAVDNVLRRIARFTVKRARLIVACSILLAIISIIFIPQLKLSNDPISYFRKDAVVKTDLQHIDASLSGSSSLELVIDTGKPGGLYEPATLAKLEQLQYELEGKDLNGLTVGKVFSVSDVLKGTNLLLNGNNPDFYKMPQSTESIAHTFALYESICPEDLAKLVDKDYQKTHITLKMPYADGVVVKKAAEDLRELAQETLGPDYHVSVTGLNALNAYIIPRILQSMATSYISAFVIITLLAIAVAGRIRLGFAAMLPNLLPIMLVFALMAMCKIPLDMTTMLIGSIALGIVIDDTLHFVYHYDLNYRKLGNHYQAVEHTLLTTGRAMFIASVIVIAAFLTDTLSSLSNIRRFGGFIALIVFLAILSDFIITPAIMTVISSKRQKDVKQTAIIDTHND